MNSRTKRGLAVLLGITLAAAMGARLSAAPPVVEGVAYEGYTVMCGVVFDGNPVYTGSGKLKMYEETQIAFQDFSWEVETGNDGIYGTGITTVIQTAKGNRTWGTSTLDLDLIDGMLEETFVFHGPMPYEGILYGVGDLEGVEFHYSIDAPVYMPGDDLPPDLPEAPCAAVDDQLTNERYCGIGHPTTDPEAPFCHVATFNGTVVTIE